jgi:hypothetical protein
VGCFSYKLYGLFQTQHSFGVTIFTFGFRLSFYPAANKLLRLCCLGAVGASLVFGLVRGAGAFWKIHRSSLVSFKGSFKDPRYCSLGFLCGSREEAFEKDSGQCTEGTVR